MTPARTNVASVTKPKIIARLVVVALTSAIESPTTRVPYGVSIDCTRKAPIPARVIVWGSSPGSTRSRRCCCTALIGIGGRSAARYAPRT